MEAIILAGGLGTRLRPAVPHLPNVLAPVGGRPFLTYVLEFASSRAAYAERSWPRAMATQRSKVALALVSPAWR